MSTQSNSKPTFKDSLKSWDTENILDRYFYRPIGYRIALLLSRTSVTPNLVTIISIFIGVGGCLMFYPRDLTINLMGFALLVFANILDCVDGQLARITGIKSEIGRILDGFCGDLWFLTFYSVMAARLIQYDGWGWWTILIVAVSGLSHLYQASMVDYYKTLHLHFLKGGINSEFGTSESVRSQTESFSWRSHPDKRFFLTLYYYYTRQQERNTPALRRYVKRLNGLYPNGYPEAAIEAFRKQSLRQMPLLDLLTFNARSLVMLLTLLLQIGWLYFAVEIVLFNLVLFVAMRRHERLCSRLNS
jgi:hypothetical protein